MASLFFNILSAVLFESARSRMFRSDAFALQLTRSGTEITLLAPTWRASGIRLRWPTPPGLHDQDTDGRVLPSNVSVRR